MYECDRTFDSAAPSYDEWVRFFFDRPEPPKIGGVEHFFHHDLQEDYTFFDARDPARVIDHMTRLFGNFPKTLSVFPLPQINQGIWVMFGCEFECQRYLFDRSVPLEKRLECIRSMYFVFADFVAPSEVEEMEGCFFMWWDLIADSFWMQFYDQPDMSKSHDDDLGQFPLKKHLNKLDNDAWQILETMFETLVRILELDDERTQGYALHGLGHLNHPKVKELVQGFIDAFPNVFTEEGLKWVQQCRDGVVL